MTSAERHEIYFRRAKLYAEEVKACIDNRCDKHQVLLSLNRLIGYLEGAWEYWDAEMKRERK